MLNPNLLVSSHAQGSWCQLKSVKDSLWTEVTGRMAQVTNYSGCCSPIHCWFGVFSSEAFWGGALEE